MNCVALLHFFDLRSCSLAQWEIRDLSDKMLEICKDKLPVVFKNAGSRCISLGYCPESSKRSCGKYPIKSKIILDK
jgi:thymidylate synthase (FAD)